MSSRRFIRFAHLKAAGIVSTWAQLARMQEHDDFPPGFFMSENKRVWDEEVVDAWVEWREWRRTAALPESRLSFGEWREWRATAAQAEPERVSA